MPKINVESSRGEKTSNLAVAGRKTKPITRDSQVVSAVIDTVEFATKSIIFTV